MILRIRRRPTQHSVAVVASPSLLRMIHGPRFNFHIHRDPATTTTSSSSRAAPTENYNLAPPPPRISAGQDDEGKVRGDVKRLIANGWELQHDAERIQKTFYFKFYSRVLNFHHIIGVRSLAERHEPEMKSEKGSLTVCWMTHVPRGLSAKDIFMAKFCDEQAIVIGAGERNDAARCS